MDTPLREQYQRLGAIKSLCIAFFTMVDTVNLKKKPGISWGSEMAANHSRLASAVCEQFKGKVVNQVGFSVMAVFDTPLECMLAALELVRKIHWDQLPFGTKAGMSHGIVRKIDSMGSEYAGEAVEYSSRLSGQAMPNQVLMDEITMDLIKPYLKDLHMVISRFGGIRELKGVGKVAVYEAALESLGFVDDSMSAVDVQLDSPEAVKIRPASETEHRNKFELPPLIIPQPVDSLVVDAPLGKVLEACTPSKDELDAVSSGYQNLSHLLTKAHDLFIRQVYLSGTFRRGAMITPLQSVDIIALMTPPPEQRDEIEATMERLERFLSRECPGTRIENDGQRIDIFLQGIQFTITPVLAFIESGKGKLMVPSRAGGFWVERNPAVPEQWMEQAVQRNGPSFLPFVRLIKAWQRTNCTFINSFHLELLTDLIASSIELKLSFESVYQWFWHTFHYFGQRTKAFIREPSQPNYFVDDYLFANSMVFGRFSRVLTDSFNQAKQGITYHRAGEHKLAVSRWKSLFGMYAERI